MREQGLALVMEAHPAAFTVSFITPTNVFT